MPPKRLKKPFRYFHLKRCEKPPLVYSRIIQEEECTLMRERKILSKKLTIINSQLEELVSHLRLNMLHLLNEKSDDFRQNRAKELDNVSQNITQNREIKTKALINLQNAQTNAVYNDYVANVQCTVNYFNELKEYEKQRYKEKIKLKSAQIDRSISNYSTKITTNNENILYPATEILAIVN